MPAIELERAFLLKHIPECLEKCKGIEIIDRYIPESAPHPKIRIRRCGDKFEITKKQPLAKDASEQSERTIDLTKEEFDELSRIPAKETVKTRYCFIHNGAKAELDFFHGKLEGLVLVDFEFSSRNDMEKFSMPGFCLAEVTRDKFLAGGMLCGKSYKDIEPALKRFGYRKLKLY